MTAESISSWSGSSSRIQGLRLVLAAANSTRFGEVCATRRVFAKAVPSANFEQTRRGSGRSRSDDGRKCTHALESASCGFSQEEVFHFAGPVVPFGCKSWDIPQFNLGQCLVF